MDYWHKQSTDTPLFPDAEWERPERKDQAGRLLIVGGNIHGFADVANAYTVASERGVGSIRVAMPDALRRTLAHLWTDTIFCPSTTTGSFAKDSTDLILQNALWADAILLPGELGRNSETAMVLDRLITSYSGPIILTKDALNYYLPQPTELLSKPNVIVVASFSQLQKILVGIKSPTAITHSMQLLQVVELLRRVTTDYPAGIVTKFGETFISAKNGQVTTTKTNPEGMWRLDVASKAAVDILHFGNQNHKALATCVL